MVMTDQAQLLAQLDALRSRLPRRLRELCQSARQRLDSVAKRRVFTHPVERFRALAQTVDDLGDRADRALSRVKEHRHKLTAMASQLTLLNPLQVLARGYSLTQDQATGQWITDAAQTQTGQTIVTRLHRGKLHSRIERIEPKADTEDDGSQTKRLKRPSPNWSKSSPVSKTGEPRSTMHYLPTKRALHCSSTVIGC